MIEQFVKYHSFGNDLILLDWQERSPNSILEVLESPQWSSFVQECCDRHRGIGGDGILILKKNGKDLYGMRIFNADGSEAETCLNGIRCLTHHLYLQHPSQNVFHIQSANQTICNQIEQKPFRLLTHIPFARYEQMRTVSTEAGEFLGHSVNVGNPHFVIFQKKEPLWLSQYGHWIEQHSSFPHKTNVAFVWQEGERAEFRALFYERGCGSTMACSSGAVAIMVALHQLERIKKRELVHLLMQGGILQSMILEDGNILLKGDAHRVFSGTCHLHP